MTAYPNLLSPIRLGTHTIRNRVWMSAHATLLVKDNLFTDAHIHYYRERAKGGVGIITMEAMAVHPTTQPYKGKAFAFDARMAPQYRKIADAVHEHGAKILAQPWHRGRETSSVASLEPVWAPSPIPDSVYREVPKQMTPADIAAIIEGYRLTARFAKLGGLDGVEVHSMAHGYLLNQFLSPATNHRRDAFGGSLENRLRIVMEILDATRQETGPDMIVGVRINGDDGHEGGLRPEHWAEIATRLEATGHLDYISVTQGTYLNRMLIYPTSPMPHGYQMPATRMIKDAVKLPVIGVGRIVDPAEAESYIARGDVDMVALARALIADPEWVNKAASGHGDDIRPCVGANWCLSSIFAQAPIACIHNPAAGAELTLGAGTLTPAATPRRVAVVGGGPAGMRAALTASDRGHHVTLFERQAELGGQVRLWAKADSRKELAGVVDWLESQIAKRPINIRRQTIATPEMLAGFETIVVATGATALKHGWTPLHPECWDGPVLPGADQPNTWSYQEVLRDEPKLGARVLLVDSLGGRQGAVVAEYLARKGHHVTFVTQLGQASPDLAASRDWGKVHGMLRKLGVRFVVDSELTAIEGTTAHLRDIYTDERTTHPADDIVFVLGAAVDDTLFQALEPARTTGLSLHLIGDALAPRRASDAIREGEIAARAI